MTYLFFPGCAYHASAGYKESTEAVCRKIGLDLNEIPDWNCCGATVFMGMDMDEAALLTGRIFALAEKAGHHDIVTGCNACFTTLRKFEKKLKEDQALQQTINHKLSNDGLGIKKISRVRHLLDVFVNDVPSSTWEDGRRHSEDSIRAGGYYGCQLTRPEGELSHPEQPDLLEQFISGLGFTPVDHSAKTMCCGASHAVPYKKQSGKLIERIIKGISLKEVDVVTTICPLCQFNLDNGQSGLPKKERLPVLFFTQLAGISLGIPFSDLGLDKLLIPFKGV